MPCNFQFSFFVNPCIYLTVYEITNIYLQLFSLLKTFSVHYYASVKVSDLKGMKKIMFTTPLTFCIGSFIVFSCHLLLLSPYPYDLYLVCLMAHHYH